MVKSKSSSLLSICVLCFASHVVGAHTSGGKKESNSTGLGCLTCLGEQPDPGFVEFLESQKLAQRLEYIKQQLIANLHVETPPKDPPKVNPLPDFIVKQMVSAQPGEGEEYIVDVDNNVKPPETRQVVLFPEEETKDCYPQSKNSLCVTFQLDEGILDNEFSSAVIWLKKNQYYQISNAQNFTIIEKTKNIRNRRLRITEIDEYNGWYRLTITGIVKFWQIRKENKKRAFMVSCDSCKESGFVSSDSNQTSSFLLLRVIKEENSRSKRGVDCVPGSQECCRDNLEIDFKTLGDFKMIIQPEKFNLYKCRGGCYYQSPLESSIPYATLLAGLKMNNTANSLLPTACCAPTKFSSLSIIFARSETTYEHAVIQNMVVESCGCV